MAGRPRPGPATIRIDFFYHQFDGTLHIVSAVPNLEVYFGTHETSDVEEENAGSWYVLTPLDDFNVNQASMASVFNVVL